MRAEFDFGERSHQVSSSFHLPLRKELDDEAAAKALLSENDRPLDPPALHSEAEMGERSTAPPERPRNFNCVLGLGYGVRLAQKA